ncbi:hypothetical protein B0I37DRAFT_428592 [Chaetomium sp. MPI-CAGE-AT-0009]|nr:hypothetical protein B0I37DRAFT_428592 [Chaetomium sp. MPI-CAGE-AT-0009]
MSPPTDIGSSKSGRGRQASTSAGPAFDKKEAGAKSQQAPSSSIPSDPFQSGHVDEMMAKLKTKLQSTVADNEAKKEKNAREKKQLEQKAKDSQDKFNAIKNAARREAGAKRALPGAELDVDGLAKKVNTRLEGAAADKLAAEKHRQQLEKDLEAARARVAELEETEKRLASELKTTKEEKEKLTAELATVKEEKEKLTGELAKVKEEKADLEKQLADTKKELLDELEVSASLRHDYEVLDKEFDDYKDAMTKKLREYFELFTRSHELLDEMGCR